jgi:hypothetical protein
MSRHPERKPRDPVEVTLKVRLGIPPACDPHSRDYGAAGDYRSG